MSLPALLGAARRDGASLIASIPPEWLQGRTAYGGLSAALALAAIKGAFDGLPPLRSVQIAFVGPLGGTVKATPTLLRRGKNSAFIGCDVMSEDGVGLRALFLFMAARESAISHHALPAPAATPPEAHPEDLARLGPGFLHNLDSANTGIDITAGYLRWRRLKQREGLDPEIELVAIADALPPAAMALAERWGPISTTTWQLNLVTDRLASADGWWLLEARTLDAGRGASSQSMTIWNRAGAPVATATQSVALFI